MPQSEEAHSPPPEDGSGEAAPARTTFAKRAAVVTGAATVATALATLTGFAHSVLAGARQIVFSPRIEAQISCGQSLIHMRIRNSGWSSVAITEPPEVVWTQSGTAYPPAVYAIDPEPPATQAPSFPIKLDRHEEARLQLKQEYSGFYLKPADAAERRKCGLRITVPLMNSPGPRKESREPFPCQCD